MLMHGIKRSPNAQGHTPTSACATCLFTTDSWTTKTTWTRSVPADDGLLDADAEPYKNCDDGETCLCKKPAAERPDHPWIMSNAGYRKLRATLIQISLRDPDCFDMYTYNDHSGYGCMEAIENLLLDFDESKYKDNREEQWAICEAAALLFLRNETVPLFM